MKQTNDEYLSEPTAETQCAMILQYMRDNGSITAIEALNHCGCFRLSARIHDLIHKFGWSITGQKITRNGKHFKEYRLA